MYNIVIGHRSLIPYTSISNIYCQHQQQRTLRGSEVLAIFSHVQQSGERTHPRSNEVA